VSDRIHELLHRNLQEVFGEATRRGGVRQSKNFMWRIARCIRRQVRPSGVKPSTNLPATSGPHILTSFTPRLESLNLFKMLPGVWRGVQVRAARPRTTQAWM
jgi:hypothetical protein